MELKLSRIVYDKDTLHCKDTSCTCKGHVDKLGVSYRQILNTCTEASQFMSTTAPVSESRPPKRRKRHSWVVTRGGKFEATGTILS